ncbi:tyrosine-type recombinase/integrase [Lachnospiraceae bacterium 62-26]
MSYNVEKVKRKDGFRYRIVKDTIVNGMRKRTYKVLPKGTKKAVAEKICNEMALNAQFGQFIEKVPITFEGYVEEIYFPKYTNYISVSTKAGYMRMYYSPGGIKEKIGNYYLSEITTEVLQDIVNTYSNEGKSPKTVRNRISFISSILNQAMKDNYMKRQELPTNYIRLPELIQEEGKAYTLEQVRIILDRAQKTGNRTVELLVGICCLAGGLRRSELIGLRWEDIVLDKSQAYIHVQRAMVEDEDGNLVEKLTKTKAGKRIIPLVVDGTVYQILQKARKEHMKLQSSEPDFQGGNSVFILMKKPYNLMKPTTLYKNFKRFMKRECSELPCYRLHDLRHTYITACTNIEGFSELSLIGTVGHSTIDNSKRYQHPLLQKTLSDMEKLEKTFDKIKA